MNEEKDFSFSKGYMSIHELLAANGVNQRNLINEVEREEAIDGRESYDMIEADIKATKTKSNLAKERFISEIKRGLGESIKKNPNSVKVIEKSFLTRLGENIKKIFTKF
jgi:hypothetical protein